MWILCFIHTYTCYRLQSVYEKEHTSIILSWHHLAYYYVSQTIYFSTHFMIPFSFTCSPWAIAMLCLLTCLYSYMLLTPILTPSSYATAELLMMPPTVHYTTTLRANIWTIDLLLPLQISVTMSIHHKFLNFCLDITFFYICPITKFNQLNVVHLLIIQNIGACMACVSRCRAPGCLDRCPPLFTIVKALTTDKGNDLTKFIFVPWKRNELSVSLIIHDVSLTDLFPCVNGSFQLHNCGFDLFIFS